MFNNANISNDEKVQYYKKMLYWYNPALKAQNDNSTIEGDRLIFNYLY